MSKAMGAHFQSGNVKDKNTQKFHRKHHFYATILARRCQNGFQAMSNSISKGAQVLRSSCFCMYSLGCWGWDGDGGNCLLAPLLSFAPANRLSFSPLPPFSYPSLTFSPDITKFCGVWVLYTPTFPPIYPPQCLSLPLTPDSPYDACRNVACTFIIIVTFRSWNTGVLYKRPAPQPCRGGPHSGLVQPISMFSHLGSLITSQNYIRGTLIINFTCQP